MDLSPFAFYLFAGIAIAFSLMVILKRSPVASAFSLVLVFFSLAGIFAMLGAHLMAALQILVAAGAVVVLFVFVIMLLDPELAQYDIGRGSSVLPIAVSALSLVLLGFVIWVLKNTDFAAVGVGGVFTPEVIEEAGGNTKVISQLMFSEYILPFEVTSILLLAAIVGVVAIAMRHTGKKPRKV